MLIPDHLACKGELQISLAGWAMSQEKKRTRLSPHKCRCAVCQRHPHSALAKEHQAINRLVVALDEKHRRRFIGVLALQWGRGAIQRLATVTGLSRTTIRRGWNEVRGVEPHALQGRVRRPGGGRQTIEKKSRGYWMH